MPKDVSLVVNIFENLSLKYFKFGSRKMLKPHMNQILIEDYI